MVKKKPPQKKRRIKTHPKPERDLRKNPPLTMLQIRFLEALPSSKTPREAAVKGGYSAKNPSRLATSRLQRYVEECPRSLIASARTRKPLGSL